MKTAATKLRPLAEGGDGHEQEKRSELRLGFAMNELNSFSYVYILQSEKDTNRFYIGFTTDIESRLGCHNSGSVPSTKPYRPWRIKTYIAFADEKQARAFEKYLKSQSGRGFAVKRL